jgi:hypothetical protein
MTDFPEINGVPLLPRGPESERPKSLRILLDLEFLPDAIPADVRQRQALKVLWRRFKARNRGCVELPRAPPTG